jgi:hypothetical protein
MKNLIIFYSCHDFLFSHDVTFDPFAQDPNLHYLLFTEGLNKLGCLIDGKVYVLVYLSEGISGMSPFIMGYHEETNLISMNTWWITQDGTQDKCFGFSSCGFSNDKAKCIIKRDSIVRISNFVDNLLGDSEYFIDYNLPAEFKVIHFDSTKRIIAGTFSFFLIDKVHEDTIAVTEGRFDGHYFLVE